ncbi:MAG TPA: efflux RND transporter periplasmic adaptor subunit [Bacteroidia bacterium]|nr:efflux RND transporter periplasmic adaptor subunit [Bacteroidia bacterium]
MKYGWIFQLLVIPVICACVQSCTGGSNTAEAERKHYVIADSLLKVIRMDSVQMGNMVNSFELTGQVDFNQDRVMNMYPLISGVIQDIHVMLGDYVTEGQVLGVIKSSEMAQYSSDIENAKSNLNLAQMNFEKTKDMYRRGLASKSDSLGAAVTLVQAKAEVVRAERVIKINGDNTSGEYVVKAPISGYIVQKMVNNNQAIRTDNGNPLFTISDLKEVWIWANVYESNVDNVHLNDEVEVTTISRPDRIFKGKIDKVMQVMDPASKAMKIRITIPNTDYTLKPQMFATARVVNSENKQELFVPSSALIFDHSQYYVLVYASKGIADIRPVSFVSSYGKKSYINGGLKRGETVLASYALQIYSELNN